MSEIGFFPTPFPDEDFRSVVYRYHVLTGYSEISATMSELFGVKSEKNTHLPRNATALFGKLPCRRAFSIDGILQNNTLWPLVRPFLSKHTIKESMQDILYGVEGASNVSGRQLSGKHNRVLSANIRYCPICLTEDHDLYGYSILHRSHQIEAIDICMVHHVKLITCCPTCSVELGGKNGVSLLIGPECPGGHQISGSSYSTEAELTKQTQLYVDLRAILQHSTSTEKEEIIQRFEIALVKKGYTYLSGRVNKRKLRRDIRNVLLKQDSRASTADLLINTRTIRTILQSDWRMRNLPVITFLMRFLCGSVQDFLTRELSAGHELPFGTGPWPCINRICPDHSKYIIYTRNRQLAQGNLVSGVFVCPTCGCTYHKRWSENRKQVKPWISTMGPKWESRLIELSTQGLTVAEIAHKMKTQWTHIVKALKRLNLTLSFSEFDLGVVEQQVSIREIVDARLEAATTDSTLRNERSLRHY